MEKIGKYQILGQIGQGAMGVVYKALDPFIERVVAVKTMSADLDSDPEVRARFFREARSAGQLSHKNIVTIYDLGEEGGKVYMAMEFLDGEDLKNIISRRDQLPLERKIEFMRELLDGLGHAHKRQVIHRDIKPGNIHVTRAGQVKILDFGLARISTSDITRSGSVMGTPNYMSPEQIRSENVDHRTDIFSAGATFYELLTYRKPFYSTSLPATFFKILQHDPEPVETVDPDIPPEFSAVVLRAVAKDAASRYQSVEEMIRDLEKLSTLLRERERTLRSEAEQALAELDEVLQENETVLADEIRRLRRSGLTTTGVGNHTDPEATSVGSPTGGYLEALLLRDRARSERTRLLELAAQRRRTAALFHEAVELEGRGEYEEALKASERILADVPGHEDVVALSRRLKKFLFDRAAEEARDAAVDVARLVEENPFLHEHASRDGADGHPGPADPESTSRDNVGYLELLDARDRARREYARLSEIVARHRALDELLHEASELERQGRPAESLAKVERVLREDAAHPAALEVQARLRDRIREEGERRRKEHEAEEHYARARFFHDRSELEPAAEQLATVLALVPDHAPAGELLRKVRQELARKAELEEQRRLACEAVREGERALTARDPVAAREKLSAGLALDAGVEGAAALADGIARFEAEVRERRERDIHAQTLAKAVRGAIAAGDDREASRQLDTLLQLDPEFEEAVGLRREIDRVRSKREARDRERREKAESTLERAIDARASDDFETAIGLARSVLALDPGHSRAADLLAQVERDLMAQRQREEIERDAQEALRRASRLAGQGALREAAATLEGMPPKIVAVASVGRALQEYRDAVRREEEERVRAAKEKRDRIAAAIAEGRSALRRSSFEDAIEYAGRALAEDPSCAEASELIDAATMELDNLKAREQLNRSAAELLRHAASLAAGDNLAGAIAVLRDAEPRIAAFPAVRRELLQYDAALEAQKRAEAKAAAIREQLESATRAFAAGDMEGCLRAVDAIIAEEASHAEAAALRERALRAAAEKKAAEERRKGAAEALRRAEQGLRAGRLDSARQALERVLALSPDHVEAARLMSELRQREAEAAERHERQQGARERLAAAAALLSAGDAEAARRTLAEAAALWPEVPGAARLRTRIEKGTRRPAPDRSAQPGRRILPLAGFGLAGALVIFGFVYFRHGSAPPRDLPRSIEVAQHKPPASPPLQEAPPAGALPSRAPEAGEAADPGIDTAALAAQVSRGNRAARRLYAAGRYDEALKAVGQVLALSPADGDAQKLIAQLERYAQKGADDAQSRMGQAKVRAESSRAPSLAAQSWAAAQSAENDAAQLYAARQFGPAAAKLEEAANLYGKAENDAAAAARAAEQERQATTERTETDRARQAFEQARTKAAGAGADRKAAEPFSEAMELAGRAQAKLEGGDLRGARAGFEAASAAMLRAGDAAGAEQREWEALKNSRDAAALQGFARKYSGGALADQAQRRVDQLEWDAINRNDAAALKAYLQKHSDGAYAKQAGAELARLEQADQATVDKQAVRQALARYAAAYDRMDARALQEAWPGIPRETLTTISQSFRNAKSMKMELRPLEEPSISGDTAVVACQRLISQTFDRKPLEEQDRIRIRLRRRGTAWVIETIQ